MCILTSSGSIPHQKSHQCSIDKLLVLLGDFNRGRFLRRNSTAPDTACPYTIGKNDAAFRSPEEYEYLPQTSKTKEATHQLRLQIKTKIPLPKTHHQIFFLAITQTFFVAIGKSHGKHRHLPIAKLTLHSYLQFCSV